MCVTLDACIVYMVCDDYVVLRCLRVCVTVFVPVCVTSCTRGCGVCPGLDLSSAGNRIDSDGVKLYCSVRATNVANRAIQALGGYGYVGEYRVEQLWRDAKLLEIGGGTLEAHHKNMTRDLAKVTKLP